MTTLALALALALAAALAALTVACIHLLRLHRRDRDATAAVARLVADIGHLDAQLRQAGEEIADQAAQLIRVRAEANAVERRARTAERVAGGLNEFAARQRTEHGSVLAARDAELAIAAAAFTALATAVFRGPRALAAARPPMPQLLPGGDWLVGGDLILPVDDLEVASLPDPPTLESVIAADGSGR